MSRTDHSFLDGMDDLRDRSRYDRADARYTQDERYELTSLRRFNVPASGIRSAGGSK